LDATPFDIHLQNDFISRLKMRLLSCTRIEPFTESGLLAVVRHSFGTLLLFSAESLDRIYVFPGNEGTLWEEKTMDMMKMSYTKMFVSSLGVGK